MISSSIPRLSNLFSVILLLLESEILEIVDEYKKLIQTFTKRKSIDVVGEKFGRGYFSILNLLQEHYPEVEKDIDTTVQTVSPSMFEENNE